MNVGEIPLTLVVNTPNRPSMKKILSLLTTLTLLSSSFFMPPAQAQSGNADVLAVNRALLDKYIVLKNSKDISKMSEMYAENYIENTGRNPSGLAGVTENWKGQFQAIPDIKAVLEDAVITGDKVVARITYTGTHTVPFFAGIAPTGKAFKLGTIDIWRVAGGKFVEHWDQVDFAGLQRQLLAK
jgi:predicted ester cyclase